MLEKIMGLFAPKKENKAVEMTDHEQSDTSAVKLRDDVKKELKGYRKQFESGWKTYEDFYYGKQHKTGEDKKTTKNHIFRIIEGEVPIMTDSMPGTVITTSDEQRDDDGKMLESAIKYVYNDQKLQLMLPSLVRDALIAAPGLLWVYYDPDGEKGQGKIRFRQVDWRHIYLDGNVQKIDDSTKFMIEEPMRKSEAQRLWPEKHDEIEDDEGEDELPDGTTSQDYTQLEDRDLSAGRDSIDEGRPKDFKADDIGMYSEVWVKDFDLEEIPMAETVAEVERETAQLLNGEIPDVGKYEAHDIHIKAHYATRGELLSQFGLAANAPYEQVEQVITQVIEQNPESGLERVLLMVKVIDDHLEIHEVKKEENPEGKKLKYPDGWRVIKSYNSIILDDGPNPDGIDCIPLVPFYAYKDKTVYGFGEIKNIHSPQTTINEVDHKEFKGLKRTANPGWLADKESGVDEKKLTNEDGIVVIKNRGTEVRRFEPGIVSNQLGARYDRDVFAMEQISGIREETQGAMPSPQASGYAINKVQMQSIGRIRLKDRMLSYYSMQRLGVVTAKFILTYWTAEKRLRFRTDDNQVQSFFFDPIKLSDLDYTIDISAGSMAGIDKDALNQFFGNLLNAGHINFQEFLSIADFPKKEVISALVKERMDYEAQLSQMQQEMIKLKGAVNPQLLTPEEQAIYVEMQRQAMNEQLINGGIGSLQQANLTSGQGV